jgi:DNA-binding helix-hairpin-helix protein with protein kinase domain
VLSVPCGSSDLYSPELQGLPTFQGVRRTQQHDAFGLAVLLFHMLFLGRHPFAGIFRHGSADKTIEDAIREFRFAYLPDNRLTEMEPPPSIPVLAEFPAEIGQLFIRAFSREGASGRRPGALEWMAPLESLSRRLNRCAANDSHHYFQALASCPWCRVESAFGRPMFGFKITVISSPDFDLVAVWAQIESVRPDEQSETPRFTNAYVDQCTPEPRIGEVKKERRKKRLLSAASILLAVIVVAPGLMQALPAICVLVAGIALMIRLWQSAETCASVAKSEHRKASQAFDAAMERWNKVQQVPAAFHQAKQNLQTQRQELVELAPLRIRRLAELKAGLRQKQLVRFLERHRIEDASIPGIGAGRKTLLRCYGVEDASDVRPGLYIKGFGPALKSALLSWRLSIELQFVFNQNEEIDPADIRALDHELAQKKAALVRALASGPQTLRQIILLWQAERSNAAAELNQRAKILAQAQVNIKALGRF